MESAQMFYASSIPDERYGEYLHHLNPAKNRNTGRVNKSPAGVSVYGIRSTI
jgi:hypothetical protein